MTISRWNRLIISLRAHANKEAYLAGLVLVVVWLLVFLGIGRTSCPHPVAREKAADYKTASAAADDKTGHNPPPTINRGALPAADYCFGFHFPGVVVGDTLLWLAASVFPGTALIYSLFSILTRLNEIEDSAENTGTYWLYVKTPPPSSKPSPPADPPPAQPITRSTGFEDFQKYLHARFREYYNPWEFIIFALSSGVLTIVLAKLIVAKYYSPLLGAPLDIQDLPVAFTAGAGLAGALVGAYLLLLKRYRTFNMYPSTYLSIFVAIGAGVFTGALWHFVFTPNVAIFLAFAIAFLTSLNLEYLVNLLTSTVAKNTGQTALDAAKSDLSAVIQNADAIDVLRTMSVFSINEFIRTDPMRLYLNLPQAIGTIDGWIDAALLKHFFAHQLDALSTAGIRQFSQLLRRFAVKVNDDGITWRDPDNVKPEIENVKAAQLMATVRDVAEDQRYDRQLGVIWDQYLEARYSKPTF